MASAPQTVQMPPLYKQIVPLSLQQHGKWASRRTDKAKWLVNQHIVPLTAEEFVLAQRHFPIVFSSGEATAPLALMGMNQGVNVFVEDDGTLREEIYMPAYARRYPFMLVRLQPDSEELSLCVDPTSDLVGEFEDGEALFEGEGPSESCKSILEFCERLEVAGNKTSAFLSEIKKHDLLIDGEISVTRADSDQPIKFSGFRMIDEKKLKDLRGDVLRTWNQNGLLPLIYAHLFSLQVARDIYAKQIAQGKAPAPATA